jgi:uncharacterized protein (DUF2126 family)/transglutaminase-like putative cysteine protease
MSIQVALTHRSHYRFDRRVGLGPHEIRLRPAAHARTPVQSYSLRVEPTGHFLNWQQDPYGNWVARVVFPEPASELLIEVDLLVDLVTLNPFDFFLEPGAEKVPFDYAGTLARELRPFLEADPQGPAFDAWLTDSRDALFAAELGTVDFLVALNSRVRSRVDYLVRMEAGVQTPDETLRLGSGSCRDSAWLLVQTLRHLGLAARFASGYLIQLKPDEVPIDGPGGPSTDFTDLHAWAEVYVPGAGWIGLDATSGLLAGEGHIPLACTAEPGSAAPVIGYTDVCQSELAVEMSIKRLHERPRVTRPLSDLQWQGVQALAARVDSELQALDVRLTMGGEPTFVSIDDLDGKEWNYTADSPAKYRLGTQMLRRLSKRFAAGGVRHHGQGKWYPGEVLPRWAQTVLWRNDGQPLWHAEELLADPSEPGTLTLAQLTAFGQALCRALGLPIERLIGCFEDPLPVLANEAATPINLDPLRSDLADAGARQRLRMLLQGGLAEPAGFLLPLIDDRLPDGYAWRSSAWPLRREQLFLLPGDSAMGYRLPLSSLPARLPDEIEDSFASDPFAPHPPLSDVEAKAVQDLPRPDPREVVRTGLCLQLRDGRLHVFLPPLGALEAFAELLRRLDQTAQALRLPLVLEGYLPAADPRLQRLAVTPDPGVLEINIHPAADWAGLVERFEGLYEDARACRLGADKFMLDGRHEGTGGGNHVTLGGASAVDSPLLRRPDLLRSLLLCWQNHPSLSYLFSGAFVGPTSQAPRVDEARDDNLYELAIALEQLDRQIAAQGTAEQEGALPWQVDRQLRNFLVDLTGNTHRSEFCIDKLYPPAGSRLGLLELRAFEMPPHPRMALLQLLLLRALVARFWRTPYGGSLIDWGGQLHDRFMLPHYLEADFREVLSDLKRAGFEFAPEWFSAFFEFRFPRLGVVQIGACELELRQAIEPWPVLGEEMSAVGTARYVDSSVERLQVRLREFRPERQVLLCNGRPVPLTATAQSGLFVAGVRFRAWDPASARHPALGVDAPLRFDLLDRAFDRSLGGCIYHVSHPGGRNYATRPVNALEAEARRRARFSSIGHSAGPLQYRPEQANLRFPLTLDLRKLPVHGIEQRDVDSAQ